MRDARVQSKSILLNLMKILFGFNTKISQAVPQPHHSMKGKSMFFSPVPT